MAACCCPCNGPRARCICCAGKKENCLCTSCWPGTVNRCCNNASSAISVPPTAPAFPLCSSHSSCITRHVSTADSFSISLPPSPSNNDIAFSGTIPDASPPLQPNDGCFLDQGEVDNMIFAAYGAHICQEHAQESSTSLDSVWFQRWSSCLDVFMILLVAHVAVSMWSNWMMRFAT